MLNIFIEEILNYLPLVLGQYIDFSLLKFPDFSIEAAFTFGAIVSYNFLYFIRLNYINIFNNNFLLILSIFISFIAGLVVGFLIFILTRFFKIPHLLASLILIGIFHGVNQFLLGNNSLQANILINCSLIFLIILSILIFLIIFLLLKTYLGLSFAICGENPDFFKNHGISLNYVVLIGLLISNGLAGISGFLVLLSLGYVNLNSGQGLSLFGIMVILLGKLFLKNNKISLFIPLIGLLIYFVLQHILLNLNFNLTYFNTVQALITLFIISFKYYKQENKSLDTLGI